MAYYKIDAFSTWNIMNPKFPDELPEIGERVWVLSYFMSVRKIPKNFCHNNSRSIYRAYQKAQSEMLASLTDL